MAFAWPLSRMLPHETKFDFVRLAPFAAALSGLAIAASIVSFLLVGLNLGIDFKGGTSIELATPGGTPRGRLESALATAGVHDVRVQGIGGPNTFIVRYRPESANPTAEAAAVEQKLTAAIPGVQFKSVSTVGAKVSGELFRSGFMALGLAIALMLVYIWVRFQLQFGFGAVIAIFHDIFLTIGICSILHIEFSTTSIAALLTVIGYSMNEKVITFDRLRENLRKYRRTPLREVINLSENERLSRTLITGTTAILALVGALFLGGPALFPLVFTMTFGIIIGTYSSIYVALPVILLWGVKRDDAPAAPIDPNPSRARATAARPTSPRR